MALIANNDPASKSGSHWIAMFIINDQHVYYFDSLGKKPNDCVQKYLNSFRLITSNVKAIQSMISENCGYYCIYFVYCMCSWLPSSSSEYIKAYKYTLSKLIKNKNPDLYVYNFVKKLISYG